MFRIWDSLDDGKPEPTAFWTASERVFLADGEKSDAILAIGISESTFQTADLPTRSTFFRIHNNISSPKDRPHSLGVTDAQTVIGRPRRVRSFYFRQLDLQLPLDISPLCAIGPISRAILQQPWCKFLSVTVSRVVIEILGRAKAKRLQ
jgi:hypothetical protein